MTDLRTETTITDLPSPAPDSPVEALGWLGDTADEVAEGLRARGIKGTRTIANDCPLARYLKTWWENASVFYTAAVWRTTDLDDFRSDDTPEPCFQFIRKFDKREYPDLLA